MKSIKYIIVAAISLVMASISYSEDVSPLDSYPKERVHLFLLAGQSNMAGRGEVEAVDQVVNPRVFSLSESGEWIPAVDPIHFDKKVAGVGLGKSFALQLLEDSDEDIVIGLIPASCGGSPISSWAPGAYHDQTKSHPYDDAMNRVRRARRDGVLKGILWHQGESDCRAQTSSVYADKLRALIERFRDDLDAEELPFIIGQLGQFSHKPWSSDREKVNDAHVLMTTELSGVAFVVSDELTAKADNIHFNSKSLRIFGRRFADVYLKTVE